MARHGWGGAQPGLPRVTGQLRPPTTAAQDPRTLLPCLPLTENNNRPRPPQGLHHSSARGQSEFKNCYLGRGVGLSQRLTEGADQTQERARGRF